jgi:hypothetical protein
MLSPHRKVKKQKMPQKWHFLKIFLNLGENMGIKTRPFSNYILSHLSTDEKKCHRYSIYRPLSTFL